MKLLKVCEGREMGMMFSELSCFGEVGMVVKDGDVVRRSAISWSNFFAPFRQGGIRKALLLEEVLLAAIQPL